MMLTDTLSLAMNKVYLVSLCMFEIWVFDRIIVMPWCYETHRQFKHALKCIYYEPFCYEIFNM